MTDGSDLEPYVPWGSGGRKREKMYGPVKAGVDPELVRKRDAIQVDHIEASDLDQIHPIVRRRIVLRFMQENGIDIVRQVWEAAQADLLRNKGPIKQPVRTKQPDDPREVVPLPELTEAQNKRLDEQAGKST